MSNRILAVVIPVLLLAILSAAFTVDQTERAIVLQFGKPVGQKSFGPGLHFKIPFVQNVIAFDARVQDYDAQPEEILTQDKKAMVVDNYAKWRIVDPLEFYRTVNNIPGAQARLDDTIKAAVREALGRYTLVELVSLKRQEIMDQVTTYTRETAKTFGVEVLDVRIKRTDLPSENERAIYGRMKAERERQAKQYRSEGREAAARITAKADKERTIILADAERQAEIARGEGDGEATRIYADALKQSPEFYGFKRSLEAYEKSLTGKTKIILTPKSPFLKYFE